MREIARKQIALSATCRESVPELGSVLCVYVNEFASGNILGAIKFHKAHKIRVPLPLCFSCWHTLGVIMSHQECAE